MFRVMFSSGCFKVAFPTALTLGTIYFILNHSVALWQGDFNRARALAGIMQYIIPYFVCAYGYARRKNV